MLNLGLHTFGFLCFVDFLFLEVVIMHSLLSVVPIILVLLLGLLPSPRCVLVFKVDILHVFDFVAGLSKLGAGKYLCRLLFQFLALLDHCIAPEYHRAWTIWFVWLLGAVRMFRFSIISGTVSRRVAIAVLRIIVFGSWAPVILPGLWELLTHQFSFKSNIIIKVYNK